MKAGDRVRLRRDVERYPIFIAKAGSFGTILSIDDQSAIVKMDDPLENGEDWNNSIYWEAEYTRHEFVDDVELAS